MAPAGTLVATPRAAGGRGSDANEPGAGARILLVDDDDTVRDVLDAVLTQLGHEVIACASGRRALEVFDTGPLFDLLLTDLGMPGMRGDELALLIRLRCPDLPIVVLTGYDDSGTLDPDWTVVTKPVAMFDLDVAIRRALAPAT